jgi:hypothetical protein
MTMMNRAITPMATMELSYDNCMPPGFSQCRIGGQAKLWARSVSLVV